MSMLDKMKHLAERAIDKAQLRRKNAEIRKHKAGKDYYDRGF